MGPCRSVNHAGVSRGLSGTSRAEIITADNEPGERPPRLPWTGEAIPQPFRIAAVVALSALISFGPAEARSSHSHGGGLYSSRRSSSHRTSPSYSGHSHSRRSKALPGVARDSHGHVKRSETAKRDFKKQSGYPHGRPGYVVDHVVPLARGRAAGSGIGGRGTGRASRRERVAPKADSALGSLWITCRAEISKMA